MSGVVVTFAAPTNEASAALFAPSVLTNANGAASVTATANASGGSYTVKASVGTLSASFSLTNIPYSPCDVNQDGATNVLDVQKMINEGLGPAPAVNDLNSDGKVNVVEIQIVINAVLKLGCSAL
jgi:hypothetical protein